MAIESTANSAAAEKRRAAFWWVSAVLGGLLLWCVLAWPVPRFFASGIPASPYTPDKRVDRVLIPGDHVQLLYHFWLARDMISGATPAFANIYEFNTDSTDPVEEVARVRRVDPYYAPFSWVYAAVSPVFGDAAGWNTAVLLSILLGAIGLFALARRHTVSDGSAFLAAMVATAFPYRWFTMHSGSPTGFAMGLAPFVPLGLDIAVRDRRIRGGIIAGLALFFAYCSDLHVFYFSAITAPFWCAFSWCCQPRGNPRFDFKRIATALLPAVLMAGCAAMAGTILNRNFAGTDMAGGRTWKEVQMFSPFVRELFHAGFHGHVFLTLTIPALFLFCLACCAFYKRDTRANSRDPQIGPFWVFALVAAAMVAVVLLSLGTEGPGYGKPMDIARKLIPKYTMIRQSAKILCLMPSLIAIALALVLPRRRQHAGLHALAVIVSILAVLEARSALRPSISLLPREQKAYSAIADDAASRSMTAHALAIPLWPGDSHWSSTYLYGAMHSRVRLVNGYSPAKRDDYVADIFKFYESMNEGDVSDVQLDRLIASGVRYLVLHEDVFPEKVSPRTAAETLRRFIVNPRLSLLAHEGTTWAFGILDDSHGAAGAAALWTPSVESISTINYKARAMDPLPVLEPFEDGAFEFLAADLFHAGETVVETGAVRLDPARDPAATIIYGPNRAMPAGDYSVEALFVSDAPEGTRLGTFSVRTTSGATLAEAAVDAGAKCFVADVAIPEEPIRFEFNYTRAGAIEFERICVRGK